MADAEFAGQAEAGERTLSGWMNTEGFPASEQVGHVMAKADEIGFRFKRAGGLDRPAFNRTRIMAEKSIGCSSWAPKRCGSEPPATARRPSA